MTKREQRCMDTNSVRCNRRNAACRVWVKGRWLAVAEEEEKVTGKEGKKRERERRKK